MALSSPPSISVAFLHPVVDAMTAHGCEKETMAQHLRISLEALSDPSTLLPAPRVYEFLEWSTELTGDLWFCARIGQTMARGGWAPVNPMLREVGSVWEFLRRFSIAAEDHGGAVAYRLEFESRIAIWNLIRPRKSPETAQYADAIAVGFFVELFSRAGGKKFDKNDCVAMTSNAKLIPPDVLPSPNVIAGARGATLRFPSEWLNWQLVEPQALSSLPDTQLPQTGVNDLKARVCHLLKQNLSDPGFGVDGVAEALGIPKWKLQRTLRVINTSVADLRSYVRVEMARQLLSSGDASVAEFATALGYNSPSNFSRAFRGKTGQSPAEFQKASITDCVNV